MKKIILGIIFLLCLFFGNIKLKASIDNVNYSSEYINLYYEHLMQNRLINYENNICGYQSFTSLLSYWDNYWNDGFISPLRERKGNLNNNGFYYFYTKDSPGINNNVEVPHNTELITEDNPLGLNFDINTFLNDHSFNYYFNDPFPNLTIDEKMYYYIYNVCFFNANTNLFGQLLSMARDINHGTNSNSIITPNNRNVFFLDGMTNTEAFSLYNMYLNYIDTHSSYINLNDYYIYQLNGIQTEGNSIIINDLRNDVIQILEAGYPVICMLTPLSEGTYSNIDVYAHFLLCYEYNSTLDKIYGHTDVMSNNVLTLDTHYDISQYNEDMCITGYYAIVPKASQSHNHTWAYLSNDPDPDPYHYCPCQIYSHVHTLSYYQSYHYCTDSECGFHETHYGTYTQKNNYAHFTHCIVCGGTFIMSHDFVPHNGDSICSLCGQIVPGGDVIIYKKKEEYLE